MSDRPDLQPLIDELTEAEVGSRYLDGRVWCTVHGYEFVRVDSAFYLGRVGYNHGTVYYTHVQPHLTTSVDAILALIEKRLPGWAIGLKIEPWGSTGSLAPEPWNPALDACSAGGVEGEGNTAALALCIALLTALAAQPAEGAAP